MIRRPPRSTLFPTRRSSDLGAVVDLHDPGRVAPKPRVHRAQGIRVAPAIEGGRGEDQAALYRWGDRKSTRLNSSHGYISYAVFCLKKKKNHTDDDNLTQQRR